MDDFKSDENMLPRLVELEVVISYQFDLNVPVVAELAQVRKLFSRGLIVWICRGRLCLVDHASSWAK